jgi:putative pyruvate formate lyase activating enzyme
MTTRRHFISRMLWLGGALVLNPSRLLAKAPGPNWEPAYATLERRGLLAARVQEAYQILEACQLCPRKCGVNRLKGQQGYCRAPARMVLYSAMPHFGEEHPLVGRRGSGTIFFSNCNLRCVFCQNWPIAHEGRGREVSHADLADTMLHLQHLGCHNINLVTPTHVMPHILKALRLALDKGLRLPLVYNTSGYESLDIVQLLDGIVDIYLPDLKFMDPEQADTYSPGAVDYPPMARAAIIEMNRQVGVLDLDNSGVARRGVVLRHLVMPNRVAGTQAFVQWVAGNLPRETYVNIMAQYRVEYRAFEFEAIARGITSEEFLEAIQWAEAAGLTNLDQRSLANRDFHLRRRR